MKDSIEQYCFERKLDIWAIRETNGVEFDILNPAGPDRHFQINLGFGIRCTELNDKIWTFYIYDVELFKQTYLCKKEKKN